MKRKLSIFLRLGISMVLLGVLFHEHDFFTQIAPRLGALWQNWPWVLAGLSSAFLALMLCSLRWFILLRGYAPCLPWRVLARTEIVAAFFNLSSVGVIGGDACKIMTLNRRLPGQAPQVGVSLMLDHVAGFVGVGILFFGCLAAIWPRWEALGHDARMLLAGFSSCMGLALAGMVFSWLTFKPRVLAWGQRMFPRVLGRPFFQRISRTLVTTHDVILSLWRRALVSVLISLPLYGCIFLNFYCALRAVGAWAPLLDVVTAMPVVDAMASLPISIAGIGVRERTFEALISSFAGVPQAACVSAAFVGWLFSVFWGLVGGCLFLRGGGRMEA